MDGGIALPTDTSHKIIFRHPGYGDRNNISLILPAFDAGGGIDYKTAQVACGICANNIWDGYFTETRTGPRVVSNPRGKLKGKQYYFRNSENPTEKYPIIPSFSHWQFPHENLPPLWTEAASQIPPCPEDRPLPRQSSLRGDLMARDIACRVTGNIEGTEHAYLIPRAEIAWFSQNSMFKYTGMVRPEANLIDDARNAILLRSDIHTIFNQKRMMIIPKDFSPPKFITHVLVSASPELISLYHDVKTQQLYGVSIEFLLARFAWTIFPYIAHFFDQDIPRAVYIVQEGISGIKELSGDQCKAIIFRPPSKSRSTSPTSQRDGGDSEVDTRGRKRRRS